VNLHDRFETVPCTICSEPTRMTGTKLCDHCWNVNGGLRRFVRFAPGRRAIAQAMFDSVEKRFNPERVLRDHNVEVVHKPGTGYVLSWDHGPVVIGFGVGRPDTAAAIYVDLILRGVDKQMALWLATSYARQA
jgi:hypothetical protein